MNRKFQIIGIVTLGAILALLINILGNAIILPPFIKDNIWLLLSLLGICLFASIYLGVREQLAQHNGSSPPPSKRPAKPLSRRTVIIGLAVTGATAVGGGITWWEIWYQPHPLYTYRVSGGAVNTVAWSPNGSNRIASGSDYDGVQVWDAMNGANVLTKEQPVVLGVAWSPDGKRIASAGDDKTVQVWDAADGGNVYIYRGHADDVSTVTWSPDGKRIASGSDDKTVQVWDAIDGTNVFIHEGPTKIKYTGYLKYGVFSVAWSPDGKCIASGNHDGTVQVWDAVDGSNVYTYQGHSDFVLSVTWSPNSQRIVSSSLDNTVQVWDAANGGNVYIYSGHRSSVNSVAWSPDGKRIASGSSDKTVQVWDAANGDNVYIYRGHSGMVNSVAWSPNSKYIASGDGNGTVQVWEAKR